MSEQNTTADCQGTARKSDSASSDKDEYMIQPLDRQETENYESLLFGVVSKSDVYTSASKRLGVLYWAVFLTPEQAKQVQHPSVIITKLDSENPRADGTRWDPFDD